MNPYQFYSRERVENAGSPVVHIIYADRVQDFAEHVFGRVLTEDELQALSEVFNEVWNFEFFEDAITRAMHKKGEHFKHQAQCGCSECGADVFAIGEFAYMLRPDVWHWG